MKLSGPFSTLLVLAAVWTAGYVTPHPTDVPQAIPSGVGGDPIYAFENNGHRVPIGRGYERLSDGSVRCQVGDGQILCGDGVFRTPADGFPLNPRPGQILMWNGFERVWAYPSDAVNLEEDEIIRAPRAPSIPVENER